jgi:hypothetical protein
LLRGYSVGLDYLRQATLHGVRLCAAARSVACCSRDRKTSGGFGWADMV